MADYGIKVSKAGYDVKTATNQQLIASSSFPVWKQYMVGNGTITVPGNYGNTSLTVDHNLNYIPSFFAYYEPVENSGKFIDASAVTIYPYQNGEVSVSTSTTNTQFIMSFHNSTLTAKDSRYKYFIIIETLE